jgi:hypothetical protein
VRMWAHGHHGARLRGVSCHGSVSVWVSVIVPLPALAGPGALPWVSWWHGTVIPG